MQSIPKSIDPIQDTQHTKDNHPHTQRNTPPTTHVQISQLQQAQARWRQLFNYNADPTEDERGLFIMEQNLKTNYNWGDFLCKKPKNTIRMYIQNLNGIGTNDIEGNFEEITAHMREIQADIICFQEHNLSTEQPKIRNALNQIVRNTWPESKPKLVIAQSPIQYPSQSKPGGTLQIITGNLTGNVIMTHADALGRWTAIKLTGKDENNILIINYYQSINKKSIDKAGSKTSWAQQYVTLQKHHPKPNPTKQSAIDLQKFLSKHLKATDELNLTGDFNANLGIGNE